MTSSGRNRLLVGIVAFSALTVLAVQIAYPRIYSGFMSYDDEGYMLIALRSFVEGGALYDDVFTQYGPFYYEAWGGVFSLFGIGVDLDSGRMATLVAWILTCLGLGLATWRMTGSILLGLLVQMLVLAALGAVAPNEPMHPGGIICLQLAAIVAISCAVSERLSPLAMGLLGGAVASLVLVKINVGALAVAAVVLACAAAYPAIGGRRWLRLAIEVAFVVTPFVLATAKLGEPWAREYAAHVSVSALAVVIALRARQAGPRVAEELWWLGGGFIAVAAAVLLAVLGAGTSFGGLLDGLIEQPLRQADAFFIPLVQSGERILILDAIALAAAIAFWYARRGRRSEVEGSVAWRAGLGVFSILVGVELALSPIGKALPFDTSDLPAYQISLLAFAWVGLVPAPGAGPAGAFARLLLPPLAVMQALHAYPVAGSQLLWSSFLLIPVGALCVASGVRNLSAVLGEGQERRAALALGAVAALALTLFVADTTVRKPLRDYRAHYDALVPLGLPGAERVRVGAPEAELYQEVTAAIDASCRAFVMLPGMDSFYFWADQRPPSGYNATGWPTLYDDAAQRHVIEDIRSLRGLCLLENQALAGGWSAGREDGGPLIRYLGQGFEPIATVDTYRLLRREGTGAGL
jgi:hypothetical protein